MSETVKVPAMAKQTVSAPKEWEWVERTIWTERMLAALENGVKGDKWFSLIDKVYRLSTLKAAWEKVKSNRGSAGIDRQSIKAFEVNAEKYLNELAEELE
jgi:RNA-directed DNA polymerase